MFTKTILKNKWLKCSIGKCDVALVWFEIELYGPMSPSCSLGFSRLSPAWKSFLFGYIINPFTIKPVHQNGWILASLCQYPATLTSRLVNKTYILLFCWNKNPQALKFKFKSLNFIMLYKQDNSGKKIYRRKLHSGKFTKWNNFKSGRSNLAIAGENSQHFAAPPIVYSWNDVWEMSKKFHIDGTSLPRSG